MFTGRIGRLGYFLGLVYLQMPLIVAILLYAFVMNILGGEASQGFRSFVNVILFLFGAVWMILYICILVDLTTRRLHDIGQSGWLVLLLVIPFANTVLSLILLCMPGDSEQNRYGYAVSGLGLARVLFNK